MVFSFDECAVTAFVLILPNLYFICKRHHTLNDARHVRDTSTRLQCVPVPLRTARGSRRPPLVRPKSVRDYPPVTTPVLRSLVNVRPLTVMVAVPLLNTTVKFRVKSRSPYTVPEMNVIVPA